MQIFMEAYHTPYTPKHRYWTGLLVIAQVVLYIVASLNVSNDSTIALTAISCIVCFVLLLKGCIGILSKAYRKWLADLLETFFYLNSLFLVIFTWYSLNNSKGNQEVAAYTYHIHCTAAHHPLPCVCIHTSLHES